MRTTSIEVVVSGAVASGGPRRLEPGATLEAAICAAGGLAYRPGARPGGALAVRRRRPSSRTVEVHRFTLWGDDAGAWRGFRLEHRDVLIVEWRLGA